MCGKLTIVIFILSILAFSPAAYAQIAQNPNPEDTATDVPKDSNLTWTPGLWAADTNGHEVYFGSTWAEVNSATTASAEFRGIQSPNEYDPGTLVLGEAYYWRIDEVNDPNRWKGDVWSFTVEGRARNPHPVDGANDVPRNVILRWIKGAESKWHDVYLGSTEAEVTAATTSSSEYKIRLNLGTELYDTSGQGLTAGNEYFWRIDEVNYMTVKGSIWDFMVADYLLIDDFDHYANHNKLRLVWEDSIMGLDGGGWVWRNTDANFAVDGNSILFEYWNTSKPYYSETRRSYTTGQDWSYAGAGVTALEINFFGDVNSVPDPPMYVKLSDDTNTAQVNHTDNNDVTEEWQHTWVVPLKDFTNVDLTNITSIILGIGDNKGEGGLPYENGTLYFDDIRLYPPRCFPEYGPAADFTDDCNVDMNDLFIVAREWGRSGGWGPAVPVIEYLFEEGSGTTIANTGTFGSSYDLTIGMSWDENGDPVMEPNNEPEWFNDPCRGWCMFFDGELGLHPNSPDDNGGDYLVIPPLNLNSNTVTIAAWIKPDPCVWNAKDSVYEQRSSFTGIVHSRDGNTVAGMNYGSGGGWVYSPELGYVWGLSGVWCGGAWCDWHSNITIPDWRWSMVALVIEPEQAALYLADANDPNDPNDDVLHSAINAVGHGLQEFDGRTLIAGDGSGYANRFFRGYMDAVRIYNYSLSQEDINDLSDDIPLSGTIYYPLDSDADFCVGRKDPCDPCAPVNDQIDLCDFSKFADEWLETKLWPQP